MVDPHEEHLLDSVDELLVDLWAQLEPDEELVTVLVCTTVCGYAEAFSQRLLDID